MFVRGQSDEDVLLLLRLGIANGNAVAIREATHEIKKRLQEREDKIEELQEQLGVKI